MMFTTTDKARISYGVGRGGTRLPTWRRSGSAWNRGSHVGYATREVSAINTSQFVSTVVEERINKMVDVLIGEFSTLDDQNQVINGIRAEVIRRRRKEADDLIRQAEVISNSISGLT